MSMSAPLRREVEHRGIPSFRALGVRSKLEQEVVVDELVEVVAVEEKAHSSP